jgi:hypothetical protein
MSEGIAAVTRLQGYTFELRVDEELAHQMRRFAGSCRFVFNRALRFEQEIFHLCGFRPGYADLSKEMEERTGDVLVGGRVLAGVAAVTERSRRCVGPAL